MAQITGTFKAWLNAIFQLHVAFMIETYSRNILLTISNPGENLERGTSGQKARGKKGGYRQKTKQNKTKSKNCCLCSFMYESKGNLLLNPINQFFSSVHLNSCTINSPQGELLYRLKRKRTLHDNFIIRNGKVENKIQQESWGFF